MSVRLYVAGLGVALKALRFARATGLDGLLFPERKSADRRKPALPPGRATKVRRGRFA